MVHFCHSLCKPVDHIQIFFKISISPPIYSVKMRDFSKRKNVYASLHRLKPFDKCVTLSNINFKEFDSFSWSNDRTPEHCGKEQTELPPVSAFCYRCHWFVVLFLITMDLPSCPLSPSQASLTFCLPLRLFLLSHVLLTLLHPYLPFLCFPSLLALVPLPLRPSLLFLPPPFSSSSFCLPPTVISVCYWRAVCRF